MSTLRAARGTCSGKAPEHADHAVDDLRSYAWGGRETAPERGTSGRRRSPSYFTSNNRLSEWLWNSGAYMHWMPATPVW